MSLPTKDAPGPPSIFMFDYSQQDFDPALRLDGARNLPGTINCSVTRRAAELVDLTSEIDLPPEWMLACNYLVADALMDDQGMAEQDAATAERIKSHAAYWNAKLLDFDRPTSVFLRSYGKQNNAYGNRRRY